MKEKFFLFLLMFCISQFSYSQITWCPPGATWHNTISYIADGGYAEIKFISDTVFMGVPCKKLIEHQRTRWYSGGAEINVYKDIFTYESGNVVFVYDLIQGSNNWDTLFNFNTLPGVSWHSNSIDTFHVEVVDTGSNIINGLSLKWMHVIYPTVNGMQNDTVYDRIGRVGLYQFYILELLVTDAKIGGLCNYSDSSFAIYGNPDSICMELPSGINESEEIDNSISIYPNPSSDELSIDSKQLKINSVEITDVTGKLLMRLNPNNSIIHFNISSFVNGIYFIKIQMPNGDFIYKKIIKQ